MFYSKPKMGHLEICSNTLYKEERKKYVLCNAQHWVLSVN